MQYDSIPLQHPNGKFCVGHRKVGGRKIGTPNMDNTLTSGDIDDLTWDKLRKLEREELMQLIKRIGGAVWGYALATDEEKAEAAQLRLYTLAMNTSETHKVIPALKEWFDRVKGKPAQSIDMNVKDERMDRMPIDRLLRLADMLDEDDIVINPRK